MVAVQGVGTAAGTGRGCRLLPRSSSSLALPPGRSTTLSFESQSSRQPLRPLASPGLEAWSLTTPKSQPTKPCFPAANDRPYLEGNTY